MKNENIIFNIPNMDVLAMADIIETEPSTLSDPHYHDELEFLPIYRGTLCCKADGVEYVAHGGDIIFVFPGVIHETYCPETDTKWGLLQFRESNYLDTEIRKIIKYSVKFQDLEGAPVRILRSKDLFDSIDMLLSECKEKQKAYDIMTRSYIFRILGILYRENILSNSEETFKSSSVQKILPAIIYINKNFAADISLDVISDMLNFDRSYFCRIFKSATGATFTEYLNFVRVCKAEKKLSSTTTSILSIAYEVGFSSLSYFNKVFKKYKGCSPSAYRNAKYYSIM